MLRLILVCLALAAMPLPLGAQSGGAQADGEAAAIRSVIESQLHAFGRDDGAAAFSYASPAIQGLFRTPDIFMDMVRNGYAPVYRPQHYEFQALDRSAPDPVQEVLMVGPDGRQVIARYTMQRQPDGSWRIHGCILTEVGLSV